MKKIIGLAIAAIIVITVAGVGSWAYFNDTETSNGNLFTAGTLNLVPSTSGSGTTVAAMTTTVTAGGDGLDGHVVFDKVSPGDSGTIKWVFYNNGSLSGNLTISANQTASENTSNDPEAKAITSNGGVNLGLDSLVQIRVQRGVGATQSAAEGTYTDLINDGSSHFYGNFPKVVSVLNAENQTIAGSSGQYVVYLLSWNIPATNMRIANASNIFDGTGAIKPDNIIQGDSENLSATFTLTQNHTP
jgi:predicted ribosomally synthesized peptide with SipW-like signal peptide